MNKTAWAILLMLLSALVVLPTLAQDSEDGEEDDGPEDDGREDGNEDDGEDDGEDDDGDDDEDEREREETRREFKKFELEDDRLEVESESRSGDTRNKFKFVVKVESEDHARLEFRYFRRTDETKADFRFRVDFLEIVEYNDVGTPDNGYDSGDTVLSTYDIGGSDWRTPTLNTETLEDGTTVRTVNFTTSDGVFSFSTRIADALLITDGTKFTPEMIKINIAIWQFPYQGTDTTLALKTRIIAREEFERDEDSDEAEVAFGAGFFSWLDTVLADGEEVEVKSSTLIDTEDDEDDDGEEDDDDRKRQEDGEDDGEEDEGEDDDGGEDDDDDRDYKAKAIYFAYITDEQPNLLFWDPTLGYTDSEDDSAAAALGAVIAVIASAAMVLVF